MVPASAGCGVLLQRRHRTTQSSAKVLILTSVGLQPGVISFRPLKVNYVVVSFVTRTQVEAIAAADSEQVAG